MKKFIVLFLIFICLSFSIIKTSPVYAVNTFREGVYKPSDFNYSPANKYTIQNVSNFNIYVILFDENQVGIQAMQLAPKSEKYNLIPLKPDYRLVIVGKGEVYIS